MWTDIWRILTPYLHKPLGPLPPPSEGRESWSRLSLETEGTETLSLVPVLYKFF